MYPRTWNLITSGLLSQSYVSTRSRQTLEIKATRCECSQCERIRGTGAARRGGVNDDPGGGLSPSTRLIEKQIAANKACNKIMDPSVLRCSRTRAVSLDPVQQRRREKGGKKEKESSIVLSGSKRWFVFGRQQPVKTLLRVLDLIWGFTFRVACKQFWWVGSSSVTVTDEIQRSQLRLQLVITQSIHTHREREKITLQKVFMSQQNEKVNRVHTFCCSIIIAKCLLFLLLLSRQLTGAMRSTALIWL